ncbi:MAG: radical SAM family heme chaperone HemW [Paracoccaceae bacterium]
MPNSEGGFGIYLHWPFCEAKCPYCDFNSHVVRFIDQARWKAAYLSEIDRYAQEVPDRVVGSIFFGGGTPSLMDPRTVSAIIHRIKEHWRITNDIEITLEANPSSVEADKFLEFRAAGVNRVSLGVQALNDNDLKTLGRLHTSDEALTAMAIAQKCFDRVSFDLICARQNQTVPDWQTELRQALALGFDHLSLYQLTIEDGTAFADRYKRGTLRGLPDDNSSADMYDVTRKLCAEAGLPSYEVSNFSRPGSESKHNLVYWRYGEYLGIGPGAHGRILNDHGHRFATETRLAPGAWLSDVENNSGETLRNRLSAAEQAVEYAMMSLRLREGMSVTRYQEILGQDLAGRGVRKMLELGAIVVKDDRLIVCDQYVGVLNSVLAELLDD